MQKLPPIEKIYEAYSAIADGRIALLDEQAVVLSSNGKKEYSVTWSDNTYTANESATYWQRYAGYPIIAVLFMQKKLPLEKSIAARFGGINWTELNAKYKRDYGKATEAVFDLLDCDMDSKEQIRAEVDRVYNALKGLDITVKRGSKRPPKSS